MHIVMKRTAPVCGRPVVKGTVLDLPEVEAKPLLKSKDAAPWPEEEPAPELLDENGVPVG